MAVVELPGLLRSAALVIVLYAAYWIYWELTVGASRRRIIKENGCEPPKKFPTYLPLGLDLLRANLKAIKERKVLENQRKRFFATGNTMQLTISGITFLATTEPENLKTMLSLNFKDYGLQKLRQNFVPLLGNGIFTTDGAAWQHSRELLRPNFARHQIGDLTMLEQHVNHLIQAIPREGSTVDLQQLFFRLTLDSATGFLFGKSTNCLAPGIATESSSRFAEAFNRSQEAIGGRGRFGIFDRLIPNWGFKRDAKVVHDFADKIIEEALESRKSKNIEKAGGHAEDDERYVFLQEVVKQTDDVVQIRSEILNILLAGRDTTASLLGNVWFILARRPDIWSKLRSEVDELNGEQPTFEQIKQMKYLRYVMNESLRLYPVVPGNARLAVQDTILPLGGGADGKSPVYLPKDSIVTWSTYTMHRRTDYYGDDAEEFKPERWETLRVGWEYLPFNGGPRICIGQQFALTEASYVTIRLMQEFSKVESRDDEPWREWLTLTCASYGGAKVALTPA
ncbi:MAG: hypothetical protein M1827_005410 [Pycnora praestabilis]|nr:MAG: hypothetical protein M1827_005410 [Pycnora praestabilis]